MKLNNTKKQAGLTLIEITLVIAVLLGLISVLFIGVSAYKAGSDRSKCILNISNVQKATRSYQNLYELVPGDALASSSIMGAGKMLETIPVCPVDSTADATDDYVFATNVPVVGSSYSYCNETSDEGAALAGDATSGFTHSSPVPEDHWPTGGTSGW